MMGIELVQLSLDAHVLCLTLKQLFLKRPNQTKSCEVEVSGDWQPSAKFASTVCCLLK